MSLPTQPVESLPAGDPAPRRRPRIVPEKYFRWRAGEITRLEAFCDVIFGFALTLLVVSLEVPHTFAELKADMRGFFPFAICFAQLVMIWRSHYKFSRRYGLQDPYTVFLNMVLLFLVLFYVYPLKFVFTLLTAEVTGDTAHGAIGWYEASVLMRIYAVGFVAVFTVMFLMYVHAYRLRRELELNPVEVRLTQVVMRENAILIAVGSISFALAFRRPDWAGLFYSVLAVVLTVHGIVSGRSVRLLAEKLGIN
jgi:uncharacterized membrane protein